MASPMPRLSVIMPNHNHARALEVSLRALTSQTRPPDEIVIVDDGSTDDSVAVIEQFAARCPAIRLLRHERNLGVTSAVNNALAASTGEYVMFASADERVSVRMCEELLAALQGFPQAMLAVSGHTEWFAETGELRRHDASSELGMWYVDGGAPVFIDPERLHGLLQRRYVMLGIHTAMFRRQAILEVGGFHHAMRWHSDWFLIYAVALRHGFVAVPRHYAWFRVTAQSYSAVGVRDSKAQRAVALAIQARLAAPELADVRAALLRSPQAMSPILHGTVLALLRRPADYALLLRITLFWLREVVRGRRPGAWAKVVARMRGRPTEPPRVPVGELTDDRDRGVMC